MKNVSIASDLSEVEVLAFHPSREVDIDVEVIHHELRTIIPASNKGVAPNPCRACMSNGDRRDGRGAEELMVGTPCTKTSNGPMALV